MDNSIVQVASNYVGIEPVGTIEHWDRSKQSKIKIRCPHIAQDYNKSMVGVDLVDMLIELYRTEVKTTRWDIKVFWHMIDIVKVNSWLLYCCYCNLQQKKQNSLLVFSCEIAECLIYANKPSYQAAQAKRRPKRSSVESMPRPGGKKPAIPLPVSDVRYDQAAHWLVSTEEKKRRRLCQS